MEGNTEQFTLQGAGSADDASSAGVKTEASRKVTQRDELSADAVSEGGELGGAGQSGQYFSTSSAPDQIGNRSKRVHGDSADTPSMGATTKTEVSLRSLLETGVHFGHQTSRWHPKMSQYIYTSRNGIHIISLPKTIECWSRARAALAKIVGAGGSVLFVGTKRQAQEVVASEAGRCGAFHVSRRWLGGMLTNFETIRNSIERMKKLETLLADDDQRKRYTKKELLMMSRELEKLEFSLGGIRDMHGSPQALFVVDIKREDIAVKEAQRLDIPVFALVDTNCDPSEVEYPIPSNDDATRAIRLFCSAVADTVVEARKVYEATKGSIDRDNVRRSVAGRGRGSSDASNNRRGGGKSSATASDATKVAAAEQKAADSSNDNGAATTDAAASAAVEASDKNE